MSYLSLWQLDNNLYTTDSPLTSAESEATKGFSISNTSHFRQTLLKEPWVCGTQNRVQSCTPINTNCMYLCCPCYVYRYGKFLLRTNSASHSTNINFTILPVLSKHLRIIMQLGHLVMCSHYLNTTM